MDETLLNELWWIQNSIEYHKKELELVYDRIGKLQKLYSIQELTALKSKVDKAVETLDTTELKYKITAK